MLSPSSLMRHPPIILMGSFLVLILMGTIVLLLPGFTYYPIGLLKASFTATSAVTVTGLNVVDPSAFTTKGHVVLALLAEAGGLGFITFAVLGLMVLQRRLSIDAQIVAKEALGVNKLSELNQIARFVFFTAFIVQSVGWLFLFGMWVPVHSVGEAAFKAFFYSIMAFNNAGFALTADNIMPYAGHPGILLTLSTLFMIGGLGIFVIMDIVHNRRYPQFKVNSKIVLISTLTLNFCAFILIFLLEKDNISTLGMMSLTDKLSNAWFLALTPRTAGFNNVPVQELQNATTILTLFLMFVGGGSYSTAGGLKLSTFVVLLLTTRAFLRTQDSVTVMRRSIPERQVRRAIAILIVALIFIVFSVFTLMLIEKNHHLIDILFEVISAFSTVGLSRGITSSLTPLGEVVLMFMMFMGRVGVLSIGYLIALPKVSKINYPPVQIDVG